MSEDRHIYGEINNKTDMKRVFLAIRSALTTCDSILTLVNCQRRIATPCSMSVKTTESAGPPAGTTRTLLSL
jgi:hypothetical protein